MTDRNFYFERIYERAMELKAKHHAPFARKDLTFRYLRRAAR